LICCASLTAFSELRAGESAPQHIKAYYTRLLFEDHGFTGKYADIVVELSQQGQFTFSRESGYQPRWLPLGGKQHSVARLIPRTGDGPDERPDNHNIACNAAIVVQTDASVSVHWRYAPDITELSFTDFRAAYNEAGNPAPFYADYAGEYFTIHADGKVVRTVKSGCYRLDDWNDPRNQIEQTLQLTPDGIRETAFRPAQMSATQERAIAGSPVKFGRTNNLIRHWRFDEGTGFTTTEEQSGKACDISGVEAYWRPGVSGTCLSFDSYSSAVTLPARQCPPLKDEFTVSACIAIQEYPFNLAAIVDHMDGNKGFMLGVNAKGQIEFKIGNGDAVQSVITEHVLLNEWVLPAGPEVSPGFHADYTKLSYSPEWDGLWRVGDCADIVVTFADRPWRYVFWRGTRYLPSLVTAHGPGGIWSNDQGAERYDGKEKQCYEHMSDMLCRFSNARIIHRSDARVVVHWRNASASIDYRWPALDTNAWGIWSDEYWTIYPDGISIRHQLVHNNTDKPITAELNQNEILCHPGQATEDVMNDAGVIIANTDGATVSINRTDAPLKKRGGNWNLQLVNLKGATKQFQIGEIGAWSQTFVHNDVYWRGWNHYPVQLIPSDGTRANTSDRPSSTCPATFHEQRHTNGNNIEGMVMYGLTDKQPGALTAMNRSWNFAPAVTDTNGCVSLGYEKRERVYLSSGHRTTSRRLNSQETGRFSGVLWL